MRLVSKAVLAITAPLVMVLAVACSDGPALPTSASSRPQAPTLGGAEVLVGGVPMSGLVTVSADEPSLFRVRVHAPAGPGSIGSVTLQYRQAGPNHPHGGGMMAALDGTVLCYDDGTHGDEIAGDGIYSYMDPDDRIGCGGVHAPPGEYQYSFWCDDVYGQRSNVVSVVIDRN